MKRKRIKYEKRLIFAVLFAMLAFVSVECTSAATISVPDDYATIQCAVDNATAGDTIVVKSGTYYENVNVNKTLSLRGVAKPVVDAGRSGSVITLSADGITLEGFAVTNSGSLWRDAGIKVTSNNTTISGNNVSNNKHDDISIWWTSRNNIVTGNNVSNNKYYGIRLQHSRSNTISGNTGCNNRAGIFLHYYWI